MANVIFQLGVAGGDLLNATEKVEGSKRVGEKGERWRGGGLKRKCAITPFYSLGVHILNVALKGVLNLGGPAIKAFGSRTVNTLCIAPCPSNTYIHTSRMFHI